MSAQCTLERDVMLWGRQCPMMEEANVKTSGLLELASTTPDQLPSTMVATANNNLASAAKGIVIKAF